MSLADYEQNPECQDCNYDTHICPGCGDYLKHGERVCAECKKAILRLSYPKFSRGGRNQ